MAGSAYTVRIQFNWLQFSSSIWTGEVAVNTLHCAATLVSDQPGVGAGPVTLGSWSVDDVGGTYSHTAGGVPYTLQRGWSFGGTTADTDNLYNGFLDSFQTWFSAVNSFIPNLVRLRDIRMYPIGSDGNSVSLAPTIMSPTSNLPGTATGMSSPDMAVCVSLYSALHTKRGRGRWYFGPLKNSALNSTTGLIDNTITGGLKDAFATWMTNLRDVQTGTLALGTRTLTPVILHRAAPFNSASVINLVRVGDEIDVQERRTKGRNETYVEGAVT